jgi:hypothetical protein
MQFLKNFENFNQTLYESGLRGIRSLADRYDQAEIYFHIDLDGVTSAIAMKEYLKRYDIKTVDFHVIQYGGREFDVLKPEKDTLPVLVDFAHGKTEFRIHTDHHDHQVGVKTKAKHFKTSKSNLATISGEIATSDIFPAEDVHIINTVDSADFASQNITPDDIIQFIYQTDKNLSAPKNHLKLGLVVNKLILAYKNKVKPQIKPGKEKPRNVSFLEELVSKSQPSLVSMYHNIKKIANNMNLDPAEDLKRYADIYQRRLRGEILSDEGERPIDYREKTSFNKVVLKNGILTQYGGPRMFKTGSYDRYASFKEYPEAKAFIMAWPMGLVQISKNPFQPKEEIIKDVHLGELKDEILASNEEKLKNIRITLNNMKRISELDIMKKYNKRYNPELYADEKFGYRLEDFENLFQNKSRGLTKENRAEIKKIMEEKYQHLNPEDKKKLNQISVSAWDVINSFSGGHKDITNISGLSYLPNSVAWVKSLSRQAFFKLDQILNKQKASA